MTTEMHELILEQRRSQQRRAASVRAASRKVKELADYFRNEVETANLTREDGQVECD
jgi:hypothetical protein